MYPRSLIALAVLAVCAACNEVLPARTNVRIDPETSYVLIGTRHGNRNPDTFVQVANRTWGLEGSLELTSIGKRQAYGFGREFRRFIGTQIVGTNYQPSEAKFYSSSANRCQATLQVVLAGIFPPSGYAEWNTQSFDNWSPVPYTIDDPLLRMYSIKNCINSDKAWQPIDDETLPDLVELVEKSKPLFDYMVQSDSQREPTIVDAADIADNIIQMDFYNAPYPAWLANPTLEGYNASSIRRAYLNFVEAFTIRCADYEPCRDLMGGVWVQHVLTSLDSANLGKGPKLIGYASHTEVTLSTMKLLGIDKKELTTSAGFVIEFKKNANGPAVRLLNHDPNPIDDHVIYKSKLQPELAAHASAEGWIPLDKFKEYANARAIKDWQAACGIEPCPSQ